MRPDPTSDQPSLEQLAVQWEPCWIRRSWQSQCSIHHSTHTRSFPFIYLWSRVTSSRPSHSLDQLGHSGPGQWYIWKTKLASAWVIWGLLTSSLFYCYPWRLYGETVERAYLELFQNDQLFKQYVPRAGWRRWWCQMNGAFSVWTLKHMAVFGNKFSL